MATEALFPGVRQLVRATDASTPSGHEVKNEWRYNSPLRVLPECAGTLDNYHSFSCHDTGLLLEQHKAKIRGTQIFQKSTSHLHG